MFTVSAYNPAKSPITFQKSNNKFNNTQLLKGEAQVEAQVAKTSSKSLGAMFRRLALPVLTALSVAACTPDDLPDVPVNLIDTTSMSETQKQTGLIINSMYGAGEEAVSKGIAPRAAVDASTYRIPDTLVTDEGVISFVQVFDKSNPDTIKSKITPYLNSSKEQAGRTIDVKYYFDENKNFVEDNGYKSILTINEKGNVVKKVGVSPLEYIKKDNANTIEKYLNTGAERLIKVIKKI